MKSNNISKITKIITFFVTTVLVFSLFTVVINPVSSAALTDDPIDDGGEFEVTIHEPSETDEITAGEQVDVNWSVENIHETDDGVRNMTFNVTGVNVNYYHEEEFSEDQNLTLGAGYTFNWENDTYENFTWSAETAGEYTINITAVGHDGNDYTVHEGQEVTITVVPDEVDSVEIEPSTDQTITAGNTINFTAEAYDEFDNLITDNVTEFDWDYIRNFDETENIAIFDQAVAEEYNVSATYNGEWDNITVTVEEAGVDEVSIDPAEDQEIISGETIEFIAEAYAEGELITDYPEDFGWENATNGLFDTTEEDEYNVSAEFEGLMSNVTNVTVIEGYQLTVEYNETHGDIEVNESLVESGWTNYYENGSVIELEAFSAEGRIFKNWTANEEFHSDDNLTTIMMDEDKTVVANFAEAFELTIDYNETYGWVEIDGEEVDAGWTSEYANGTVVELEAFPEFGYEFEDWLGNVPDDIAEDKEITLEMNQDRTIQANFTEVDIYELTINIEGEGTTDPAEGNHTYYAGENVTIKATPDEDWEFLEWTGDYESEEEEIEFTMDSDMNITAVFKEGDEPFFRIEITDHDEEVEEGQYVTVEFTVENTGYTEDTQDITFSIGGTEIDKKEDVTLEAGEEESFKFFWEAEGGSHLLTVASEDDEDTVPVSVSVEAVDDEIPGFTSIILILGTLSAAAIYYKKDSKKS